MRDLITLGVRRMQAEELHQHEEQEEDTDKLAFKKFCPACRSHTLHKEGKV